MVEHKADVNAKNNVSNALTDCFHGCFIVRKVYDAAVVSAEWRHSTDGGLMEGSH